MATIIIPTPLRKFTDQNRSFTSDKDNLSDALQQFVEAYPDVEKNLLDDGGKVRSFIKIYIGDEEVSTDNSTLELEDDTEVSIIPAIAGGVEQQIMNSKFDIQ
ncbi:MAG TPA: MoaD/ThiS family protein [Fodinibius sp.]|nr:MoaD/ThiS family protein [Fodinibius sp.]